MRRNTYDASTGTVTIAPVQAVAYRQLASYYADIFASGRADYAIPAGARCS